MTNVEIPDSATQKDSDGVGVGGETEAGEHKARFWQPGGRAVGCEMKVKVYFFMKVKVLFSGSLFGEPLVAR